MDRARTRHDGNKKNAEIAQWSSVGRSSPYNFSTMTMVLPQLPQMRLNGPNPAFEVGSSNMAFVLGEASGGAGSLTLRTGLSPSQSAAFLCMAQLLDVNMTTIVSATDARSTASNAWATPSLSMRTWADCEELRIDSAGAYCRTLSADCFTNLVSDYMSANAVIPPSASALNSAYIDLSNMIVTRTGTGGGSSSTGTGGGGSSWETGLIDSYVSTSVLNAPTANALRAAYFNMSNAMVLNVRALTSQVPNLVRSAAIAIMSNVSGGDLSALTAPQFALSNDTYMTSLQDGQPRMFFASGGPTVSVAPGMGSNAAFRWLSSDLSQDVMAISGQGDMGLRGALTASNGLTILSGSTTLAGPLSATAGVTISGGALVLSGAGSGSGASNVLILGTSNIISVAGSNVGLNLADGNAPVATLHVNGSVFSTENMFALSDASVKADIQPIAKAAAKIMCIRGYSYIRTDIDHQDGVPVRQVGVIAQDVSRVLPEAVRVGDDGRMSVAYGNLVALAIEAIRELSLNQRRIQRRLEQVASSSVRFRRFHVSRFRKPPKARVM